MSAPRPSGETKLPTAKSRDRTLSRNARCSAALVGRVGTSESNSAPIGPETMSETEVNERMRSTPRTFLIACVARWILPSDVGEKTSSPAGASTPTMATRSEPKRRETSWKRRTSGSFVGRKTSRSSSFLRRVVPTAASAAMRTETATTVRGQRVAKEMI